ncbi:protein of unknown function [Burkholderia multivorans]
MTQPRPAADGRDLRLLSERRTSRLHVGAAGKLAQPPATCPGHMSTQSTDVPANVTPMTQESPRLIWQGRIQKRPETCASFSASQYRPGSIAEIRD